MNDGVEAFRLQLQKELGLSIGPKDPLLAQWLSQKELLEENAAEHQRLLAEFEAALAKNQTAWSEQAKALAQFKIARRYCLRKRPSLTERRSARRFKKELHGWSKRWRPGGRIAWVSLAAAVVSWTAAICAILVRVIH